MSPLAIAISTSFNDSTTVFRPGMTLGRSNSSLGILAVTYGKGVSACCKSSNPFDNYYDNDDDTNDCDDNVMILLSELTERYLLSHNLIIIINN